MIHFVDTLSSSTLLFPLFHIVPLGTGVKDCHYFYPLRAVTTVTKYKYLSKYKLGSLSTTQILNIYKC